MVNDSVVRFHFSHAPIRGHWVRLEGVLEETFRYQTYPVPIQELLGEMLAAVALVADGLKFDGAVALQSRGDSIVRTSLAECREHHKMRAIARLRLDDKEVISGNTNLLGNGQLALSLIYNEPNRPPYQGMIDLSGNSLAANLETYFATSEQVPTRVFLHADAKRATGLLLQRLPLATGSTLLAEDSHAEQWREVSLLAQTLSAPELHELPLTDLLTRLFKEHEIAITPPRGLHFECTCSRAKSSHILSTIPAAELIELLESLPDNTITVTCEFCGHVFRYNEMDTHQLFAANQPPDPPIH